MTRRHLTGKGYVYQKLPLHVVVLTSSAAFDNDRVTLDWPKLRLLKIAIMIGQPVVGRAHSVLFVF